MTEIQKERIYGNFKPSKAQRAKTKAAKKKDTRPGMSEEHCKNLRKLQCIACGSNPSEVHHLKATGERGAGMRSPDKWGVPLCHECHINGVEKVGSRMEIRWFTERGIYCLDFASALWQNRHDFKLMKEVWSVHWDKKTKVMGRYTGEEI